jgi:hypothetical protein
MRDRLRSGPKRELWFAWYSTVAFYGLYAVVFFLITRTQPPAKPYFEPDQVVDWFDSRRFGLQIGFALIFILGAWSVSALALIAASIRRMSVSRVFANSYLVLYLVAGVPGFLYFCVAMTTGALRPERNPELQQWLFDFGYLSFTGTMGVFLIGSLVWMAAVMLDENNVFPKWFGLLNLCNALTEVVVAPSWIFKRGPLAWDGAIAWWIDMVVFGIYTGVFIFLLRNYIMREDFGDGPLPPLDPDAPRRRHPLALVIR